MSRNSAAEIGNNDSDFDYMDDYNGAYNDDYFYKESDRDIPAFSVYTVDDVKQFLSKSAEYVSTALKVDLWYAMTLLSKHSWDVDDVVRSVPEGIENGAAVTLNSDYLKLVGNSGNLGAASCAPAKGSITCSICCLSAAAVEHDFRQLPCRHTFCTQCWKTYIEMQVNEGNSIRLTCMETKCQQPVSESFVLSIMGDSEAIIKRYRILAFEEYVSTHPNLRFCRGPNCCYIIYAKERKPIAVRCNCGEEFCFNCGDSYHAPASCAAMKKWLLKIGDDSLTDIYMTAQTKGCPKCAVNIEKNGGCNHMHCSRCNYEFCWVCLGDWKTHADEAIAVNCIPNRETEVKQREALEALQKYDRHYRGWQSQATSLKHEEEENQLIELRVASVVKENKATFMDCGYRCTAIKILKECRRMLRYSYVHAYYMDTDPGRELFEFLQRELLATTINLREQLLFGIPSRLGLTEHVGTAEALIQSVLKFVGA